jgi:hypothetical protein
VAGKWYTAQSAKIADRNLSTFDTDALEQIAAAARNQVISLPPLPPALLPGETLPVLGPEEIYDHWALGHLMQIQALVKAQKTGGGDTTGPEGYTVRVYPMDWTIKAVLRPLTVSPDTLVG